ncbi:MAG: hypothetical protein CME61_09535 [Halobacteriovoraceae bacterium]|nr:hypothetical protein [Halobacteriovoraceae bacterium]|tara:strand:+ start:1591 stop:2760 length:1170 start_codon:yes stop_codon:yes gene_type:complete
MKFNPKVLILVILYFSTSNWIITDYFMSPNTKNYFLGGLIFILIMFLLSSRKYNFNLGALLFSIIGICAVTLNGFIYNSLIIQHFFLFILSFYFLNFKNTLKIYKTINRINYFLLLLIPLQMFLFYIDQSLLSYAGPVSSTGLEFSENIEIRHWISYLGSTTGEQFDFFGRVLPRFSGYLTEPSAVPNLIILPLLIESLHNKKKIITHGILIILCVFIYRSGFVSIYALLTLLLLLFQKFNLLSKKYFLVVSITVGFSILLFLPSLVLSYLENESSINIYSLDNKFNSISSRTLGLYEMVSQIKPFGNHSVEIHGVGLLVHYLILYGYFILLFLGYLFYKLYSNKKFLIFYLMLFSFFIMSKGFSSIFALILILSYATNNPPASNKYSQ